MNFLKHNIILINGIITENMSRAQKMMDFRNLCKYIAFEALDLINVIF